MTDVPTTWEELREWWHEDTGYSDMFLEVQRWIVEAEARATAAERERCLGLAMVTYDDIAELFIYETVGKTQDGSVAMNKIIRARIVPPPPVDELVLTIANQLMKGVSGGSNFTSFDPVVASMFATSIAAAIRAMEAKNV
jgi:hypothetical protein